MSDEEPPDVISVERKGLIPPGPREVPPGYVPFDAAFTPEEMSQLEEIARKDHRTPNNQLRWMIEARFLGELRQIEGGQQKPK